MWPGPDAFYKITVGAWKFTALYPELWNRLLFIRILALHHRPLQLIDYGFLLNLSGVLIRAHRVFFMYIISYLEKRVNVSNDLFTFAFFCRLSRVDWFRWLNPFCFCRMREIVHLQTGQVSSGKDNLYALVSLTKFHSIFQCGNQIGTRYGLLFLVVAECDRFD